MENYNTFKNLVFENRHLYSIPQLEFVWSIISNYEKKPIEVIETIENHQDIFNVVKKLLVNWVFVCDFFNKLEGIYIHEVLYFKSKEHEILFNKIFKFNP